MKRKRHSDLTYRMEIAQEITNDIQRAIVLFDASDKEILTAPSVCLAGAVASIECKKCRRHAVRLLRNVLPDMFKDAIEHPLSEEPPPPSNPGTVH